MVENAKMEKFKCDILSNFQTTCTTTKIHFYYTLDSHILQSRLLFLVQQQQQKIKTAKPAGKYEKN